MKNYTRTQGCAAKPCNVQTAVQQGLLESHIDDEPGFAVTYAWGGTQWVPASLFNLEFEEVSNAQINT